MKKEGFSGFFNSHDGKVNIVLFFFVIIIFLSTVLISEITFVNAMNVSLKTPGNFTYNASIRGSRMINFTFNATWSFGDTDASGVGLVANHENVSNCSLFVNSTDLALKWDIVRNITWTGNEVSEDAGLVNLTNGSFSHVVFNFTSDGNYTWGIGCLNFSNASGGAALYFPFSIGNFSFFLDASPPKINFTTTFNESFNTTQVATRAIKFIVNDSSDADPPRFSFGMNASHNGSINITITKYSSQLLTDGVAVGLFIFTPNLSGEKSNLTCTGFTTNITKETFTCNSSFNFNANGTYVINVTAIDAAGIFIGRQHTNLNHTVRLLTVDQQPPVLVYYNFTNSSAFNTTGDTQTARILNSSDGTSIKPGNASTVPNTIFAVANWTDNLTNPIQGMLQFFNDSSKQWQTLNISSTIHPRNGSWTNFSFPVPSGRNEFEGRNVSFRIIANDTLGNVNDSNSTTNVTIQINDTFAPTITINGTIVTNGTNLSTTTVPVVGWVVNENNGMLEINISIDNNVTDTGDFAGCNFFVQKTATSGTNAPNANRNNSFATNPSSNPPCDLRNGSHRVAVSARDSWGNSIEVFHTFNVQSGGIGTGLNLVNITRAGQNVSSGAQGTKLALSMVNNTNVTSVMGLTFASIRSASSSASVSNFTYVSSCNTSNTVAFKNDTNSLLTEIFPFNTSDSTCVQSGNVTLTITVTDTAGNSNVTVWGFRMDNSGPILANHRPVSGEVLRDNFTVLNVSAFDGESQIHSVYYYLDDFSIRRNITLANESVLTEGFGRNVSVTRTTDNLTPGTHHIKFAANDTMANEANSSIVEFIQMGKIGIGLFRVSVENYSNLVYGLRSNLTNITISTKTDSGRFTSKTGENETSTNFFQLTYTINSSGDNITVSLSDFNGSKVNWDKINFTPVINNSVFVRDVQNNWSGRVFASVFFNNSIEEFVFNNDTYFGIVELPLMINLTNSSNSTIKEFWWIPDESNLASRENITACSGGFSITSSTPCWNYTGTTPQRTRIFVPHLSAVVAVNDTVAPWVNVTTPTSTNHSVSMFIPNITVSVDTITCLYTHNVTTSNFSMTKSGNVCIGQTERFKNNADGPGWYNFTFFAIDTQNNINTYLWNFSVQDNTAPNNGIIASSPSTTSATVTVTNTNESVNVTVAYGTTNTSLGSSAIETDFNQTQTVTISGLTASTTYYYNVTVCDFNGNCKTNTTLFSFATSAAAAAEAAAAAAAAGGGGGGAAAPSNEVASGSRRWDSLQAGSSAVLTVNSPQISVTGVVVDVKNAVSNAEVKVASLTSNPYSAPAASKVYQYLQLTKSNIADADASKITVNFRVPKSWLTENKVGEDDVVLYRYADTKWNSLPTSKTGTDANNVLYQSTTPGFSTFAVGVKEAAIAPPAEEKPTEAPPVPTAEVPKEEAKPAEAAPEAKKPALSRTAIAWIVVALIVVVAAVGYYMWQKKKEE